MSKTNEIRPTKEQISEYVNAMKNFWLTDEAVDFMTKVELLRNGYYVPTSTDNK